MDIYFLGTGHGVPEAGKKCTSTLFRVGDDYYFVDAGCDIALELANRRIPFEKVKAIFVTHPHTDHTNGLIPFLTVTNWYYTNSNFTVYLPSGELVTAFRDPILPGYDRPLRPEQRIEPYSAGIIYNDGAVKVTAFPTLHCPHSHSFLVEAEGKRVFFSGDLKRPEIDFPQVDDLDVAILEGAHFSILRYADVLKSRNIKDVYINHYGNYIGTVNHHNVKPLQDAITPITVCLTTDGMEIHI